MSTSTVRGKAIAAGLVLALLTALAAVSCGPRPRVSVQSGREPAVHRRRRTGHRRGGGPGPVGEPGRQARVPGGVVERAEVQQRQQRRRRPEAAGRHRRCGRSAGVPGEVPRCHGQERPARLGLVEPEHVGPDHLEHREVRAGRQGPGRGVRRDPGRRRTGRPVRGPEVRRMGPAPGPPHRRHVRDGQPPPALQHRVQGPPRQARRQPSTSAWPSDR